MIFKELYLYREMIFSLVRRDLAGRYKKSVLGFLWTLLDPLLQLIVYTLVFTYILPMGIENFYIHLFVALVPWNFFSACLAGGASAILGQQDMVKKIYFPIEVLPIAFVTSQFVNMVFSFIVVLIVVVASGIGVNPVALLWLPFVMLIEYILGLGVTFFTSAVTVYLRDMQMILNVLSMALMYASPVIYSLDMVPQSIFRYYMLNPMSSVIKAYRDILYFKQIPDAKNLTVALVLSLIVLLIGSLTFSKLKRRFVEEL